jgi:hypothetical protein
VGGGVHVTASTGRLEPLRKELFPLCGKLLLQGRRYWRHRLQWRGQSAAIGLLANVAFAAVATASTSAIVVEPPFTEKVKITLRVPRLRASRLGG